MIESERADRAVKMYMKAAGIYEVWLYSTIQSNLSI